MVVRASYEFTCLHICLLPKNNLTFILIASVTDIFAAGEIFNIYCTEHLTDIAKEHQQHGCK